MSALNSAVVVTRTAPGVRRRAMLLATGAAISVGAMASVASAVNYVWIGTASSAPLPGAQFTGATNWQGGFLPPTNDPNTTLSFPSAVSPTAITARNDFVVPPGFVLNAMTFSNTNAGVSVSEVPVTIPGSSPTQTYTGFNFVATTSGTLPTININGTGSASLNTSLPNWTLGDNLTVGGSGYGNFGFASFGESVAGRSVTVAPAPAILAGSPAVQYLRLVTFNGAATHTGGTTIDGSYVAAGGFTGGPNTFGFGGTITVTPNGGGIWLGSQFMAGVSATTLQLNGTLKLLGTQILPLFNATTNPASPTSTLVTGSGTLAIGGTGTSMTVYSNSTGYTGNVVLDRPDLPQVTANTGTLQLSSIAAQNVVNGALINVPSFTLRAGGTLLLNNNVADSKQNGDRIGDTVPITMSSGNITLNGPAAAGVSLFPPNNLNETIGAITGAGFNTLTATPGGAAMVITRLSAASLARSQQGTFLFRGLSLGAGNASITFDAAPTGSVGGGGSANSTSISILPYAIGDATAAGNGASLVTYSGSGIRPLDFATEYATDLVSGPTTNARLGAVAANNVAAPATVNALVVSAAGPAIANAVTVTGSQINLTSGVLLFNAAATAANGGTAAIANAIDFGSAEAQVFSTFTAPGTIASTLTLSGSLLGTSGMTKSGNGTVLLTGNNAGLTGPLTINAGIVNFNSGAALPGTGQVVVNGAGSGAGLTYSGAGPLTVSRDIAVNTGLLTAASATAGQTLTLSGQISGPGGVNITSVGDVVLSGNNTYTGPTAFGAGTGIGHISSDANLGNGGAVGLNGGTLQADGNWTTSRLVNVSAASTLNVSGTNTATLNGPFTNATTGGSANASATLNKTGTGTLTVNSVVSSFTGPVNVNGGTMLINNVFAASAAPITVNTGGTLGGTGVIPRNIAVNAGGALSPGNSAGILTAAGTMTFVAGSNFVVELNGPTAGNGVGFHDQLSMISGGAVALGNANLVTSMGYNHNTSDVYWILVKDGINVVSGTFNGINEGDTILLGYENWGYGPVPVTGTISYYGDFATNDTTGQSGNDIVIYNIIPAPGAASLLGLGGLLAARRRRR